MIIAVDFDGTIVEHEYPNIGREKPFAIDILKKLLNDGHKLILWTVREDKRLLEAIEWCKSKGLYFHAVNSFLDEDNENYKIEKNNNPTFSRKLKVDCFIDDRNVGGLPDWRSIYTMISKRISYQEYYNANYNYSQPESKPKKKWWQF